MCVCVTVGVYSAWFCMCLHIDIYVCFLMTHTHLLHVQESIGWCTLKMLCRKVVVVGAGYIAVELAGIFNALGSDTSILIRYDEVMSLDLGMVCRHSRSHLLQVSRCDCACLHQVLWLACSTCQISPLPSHSTSFSFFPLMYFFFLNGL